MTGIYEPDSGEILFEGENIAGLAPHKITQRGIARTFQTLRLFLNMSVKENVMAGRHGHTKSSAFEAVLRPPRARREEREIAQMAEEKLAFFGDRLRATGTTSPRTRCRTQTGGGSRSRARWARTRGCSCRRAGGRDEPQGDP